MPKPDGGPAFAPAVYVDDQGRRTVRHSNLSVRDSFAGQALSAWVIATVDPEASDWDCTWLARLAYRTADAMLAERDKEGEPDGS